MHDDDDRALTPAERQRMEAELARLEAEAAALDERIPAAVAAYESAADGAATDAAWETLVTLDARRDEVTSDARALRERLAADDTRADTAAWAADRGVR